MTPDDFSKAKVIAFYLPQFYPFAENDEWWGKGFTEWTNVTRARPSFPGHYQPHLPADLGFYDLRVRETRHQQAELAKKYGVTGFCYHYYWFDGRRLLDLPLDAMLADHELDFPFCLNWANDNWTRRWDASEKEVLIAQDYSSFDDDRFVDDLIPYFRDHRYIRIGSSALFIVYRPQQIPDIVRRAERWRKRALSHGVSLHLCAALTYDNNDYKQFGFDSGVEYPPHNIRTLGITKASNQIDFFNDRSAHVLEYAKLAEAYIAQAHNGSTVFKTVTPCWDNTSRRKNNAVVVLDGTPSNFEYWLNNVFQYTCNKFSDDNRIIFINAWNEWAEGCHLEPDQKYGRRFLEAIQTVSSGKSTVSGCASSNTSHQGKSQQRLAIRPRKPVGWKVKRELTRIVRQVSQGQKRVEMDTSTRSGSASFNNELMLKARRPDAPCLDSFMDYEYEVDPNGNQAASHVLRLVGCHKRVLEIGAGSGAITRHLVALNECDVTAVEINQKSIEKLKCYTKNIHALDLNENNWVEGVKAYGPYDCVIAADVLEHLYDPWSVLKQMKSLLTDDGYIVLSLPHAGHCTLAGCLMLDDFSYGEYGLLDKTHIRFFGIKNIQTLHETVGLAIETARFVTMPPEKTELAGHWSRLPLATRRFLARQQFGQVYQLVTRSYAEAHVDHPIVLTKLDPSSILL